MQKPPPSPPAKHGRRAATSGERAQACASTASGAGCKSVGVDTNVAFGNLMRRVFPGCYKDGAFQNWSRRVKVNGIEYPNEEHVPSDYGYYVNGYDVEVSGNKLLWTEWTSENRKSKGIACCKQNI